MVLTEAAPGLTLKPRQQQAMDAIAAAYRRGVRRQLVALPTGVGKTVLGVEIARRRWQRTLFLVPREELLEQTVATFRRAGCAEHDIGILWQRQAEVERRWVVGMIQTAHARLGKLDPGQFDLVIVDECHHAGAKTWRAVLDHFASKLRLGLSATPERNDGTPLSNLFDEVVVKMTVADAVREGYLCRPIGLAESTHSSLDRVKTSAGDFNLKQLSDEINTPERNALITRAYHQHAAGRKALAFCVTIEHAQHLAAAMTSAGKKAEWISGDDPDRAEKIRGLRAGRYDVLCNAMLLTEGFDDPTVDCILMARPTKSKPLYTQAVGRGLRLSPGKADCLIIDFVDSHSKHSLASVWDFFGEKLRAKPGEKVDLQQRAGDQQAVKLATAEEQLQLLFGTTVRLDDPVLLQEIDLLAPPPDVSLDAYGDKRWHYDAATDKQLGALDRLGFDTREQDWTKGQASLMMDSAPASTRQLKLLLAQGFDVLTQTWTRAQASVALDQAKEQEPDWQRARRLRGEA